jgi:aminoglycoside 6'-N-acetyltransferase I
MQRMEMAERKGKVGAVFVYRREGGGGLGGFVEVSVRERVDGSMEPRIAYIEGWYVDEDLRGKGVGRELIARCEKWARGQGLKEIASDAELWNEESIKAHRALGFKETFRLVHFLKRIESSIKARDL